MEEANREMKRLIDVLNGAGYEVVKIGDLLYGNEKYVCSGLFELIVATASAKPDGA
jgi:hypothetical protein